MAILCLFQIDPATQEATGTIAPFCSEKCRHEAKSSLDYPDHTEGVSDVADFGFAPQCEQCGIEITESGSGGCNASTQAGQFTPCATSN